MAKKLRLTRPELKRQRDALQRYERYLPTLKLKQQHLQLSLRQLAAEQRAARARLADARAKVEPYRAILHDVAGIDVRKLAEPAKVRTEHDNVAGVSIQHFEGVDFPPAEYSLFATPPWVDAALADLRQITLCRAEVDILAESERRLQYELTKIIQRINLFEKVKIPEAQEAIRRIRIRLGDEMTAAVGRGKLAKAKIEAVEHAAVADGAHTDET